jgi:RNA polymerase sigma factor (sigma-70 family)
MKAVYLSHETQRVLIQLGQEGDVEARNKVIMNFHNLIYKQAEHYCRFNPVLVHDCAQACVLKLIEKFDQFDLRRNTLFITWAFNWIREVCQQFFAENRSVIKSGRNKHNCTASCKEKIRAAETVKQASIPVRGSEGESVPMQTLLVDESENHIELVERRDEAAIAGKVLSQLDERSQVVLMARIGGETLSAIGDRMQISKERVRQIERDAKIKFREVASRVAKPTYERLSQQHGALAS